ncbi:hypothetical protein WJX74_010027 [Apatococcus lobatus]|uniref:Uncharacterized protein n=1 Tax=Apatococcus lobatus TaxID=904363 RepID=A0AAW1SCC8_9CHLO
MQTGVYSNGNWFCHKCIALPALTSRLSPRRVSAAALDHSAPTEPHKTLMAGSFPNLGWNAIGMEELRNLPAFGALPSVWDVSLVNPTSYRYVRQDTDLWDALHQGIVTGGRLNNVLGFYEPLAGKMLGVPRSRISHQPLLSMYYHLQDAPFRPPQQWGHPPAAASPPEHGTASAGTALAGTAPAANAINPSTSESGHQLPQTAGQAGSIKKRSQRRPNGSQAASSLQQSLRQDWRQGCSGGLAWNANLVWLHLEVLGG